MEILYLVITILAAMIFLFTLIIKTKGVCYFGPTMTSDNEKIVRAANQIFFFDWPSKMHSISGNRSQMREYWTLFIRVLGKFKKDKLSDHMNITLALLANGGSSVLVYFVFSNYFSPLIGLVVALLYITSFWPYHVALYMGHVHLAQMFFLLSVLCLQATEFVNFGISYILFFWGGLFSAVSFFSSSASRKYPPIALMALIFALRDHFELPNFGNYNFFSVWLFLGSALILSLINISTRSFPKGILPAVFVRITKGVNLRAHLDFVSKKALLLLVVIGFIPIFFDLSTDFSFSIISYFFGIVIVCIHIFFPVLELKNNLLRYKHWLNVSEWASHFKAYPEQKNTFGRDLPDNFRGGGFLWNHRFFHTVMPFVYPLYVISVLLLGYNIIDIALANRSINPAINFVLLIIISFMPVIIHELTKGLKVGKAYMPTLLFLLLVPAASLNQFLTSIGNSPILNNIFCGIMGLIIVAQFVHTIYVLYSDTIPCRMAPTILKNKLKELKVKEFYTYDNSYNDSFVHTMVSTYPNEFEVHTINSISEVNSGIVVTPNTSAKSVNMETQQYAILNGDFRNDEALNELMDNRYIENIALMKIRTMGCSKYYVHESEVTSYRDLILKQVTDQDRWRGYAWILSV